MELWSEVRRRVLTGESSRRQEDREYDLNYRKVERSLVMSSRPATDVLTRVCSPGWSGSRRSLPRSSMATRTRSGSCATRPRESTTYWSPSTPSTRAIRASRKRSVTCPL
jgi:hypothetical protein